MEVLTIEVKNAKARKLIDDLVDLGIISLRDEPPAWADLWSRLDNRLPQTTPGLTKEDILAEIKAYRAERKNK